MPQKTYQDVLPNLTERQKEYIEKLKTQTGISTVISRLTMPSGSDDLIIILPSPAELNGYYDDDGVLFFPDWDDLNVIVVSDQLFSPQTYQVLGFRVSSMERKFIGNKIAVDMAVRF